MINSTKSTKNTLSSNHFDFNDVPSTWALCFDDKCKCKKDCLRHIAVCNVPDDVIFGPAVYPKTNSENVCQMFVKAEKENAAYGLLDIYKNVKQQHYREIKDEVMNLLGGKTAYYRYNKGVYLLSPEQQTAIGQIFSKYGYDKNIKFNNYKSAYKFGKHFATHNHD